jgi:hypothetical protein
MFGFATHQAEPDPAEAARRYGAEMTVPIGARLVCSLRQLQCRYGR